MLLTSPNGIVVKMEIISIEGHNQVSMLYIVFSNK